jgi:hypothetical protein
MAHWIGAPALNQALLNWKEKAFEFRKTLSLAALSQSA